MLYRSRKLAILILSGFIALSFAPPAFAADGKAEGNKLTNFFRRLFHVPVKTTQETAEMTGHALSNTGEKVLSNTGENLAEGDLGGVITQPVVGSAETVGEAVADTAAIPGTVANSDPNAVE